MNGAAASNGEPPRALPVEALPKVAAPTRAQLALAFAALYLVWGSTYFAMRVVVRSVPPFAGSSLRFLVAGGVALLLLRLRGERAPSALEWRHAWVSGTLLFCGGNGLVMWSEQFVPSGLTALIIGTSPLWFALFGWLRRDGVRPTRRVLLGLGLGSLGALLLANPGAALETGAPVLPQLVLFFGCATWVAGSLYGKDHPHHPSVWVHSAQNMLCGGSALLVIALARGELPGLAALGSDRAALLGLVYLVVFGSWIGFGAYAFLLAHVAPSKVATYAYVNPLVAVLLGTVWLDEPFTLRMALAGLLILGALAFVQTAPRAR